jgi:sugar lactone lactonase YvrE
MPFIVALALVSAQPVLAAQPAQGVVRDFTNLATRDCHNPEGIAVSPTGVLYAAGLSGHICVVTDGQVTRVISVPPGPAKVTNFLGELFEPSQGLFVVDIADFGASKAGRLLHVDPQTGAAITLAGGFLAPNAIAQNRHRTLFVSDSFAGAIYTVEPTGGGKKLWKADPKLATTGFPPFGANGVSFDRTESFLYVANADGSAGDVAVFAKGATTADPQLLHGADGIMFDVTGQLWVCANQANEIQVLSPSGTLVARYGHHRGDDAMVFPASLVFHERALYVTNLYFGAFGGKLSVLGVPFPGAPLRP